VQVARHSAALLLHRHIGHCSGCPGEIVAAGQAVLDTAAQDQQPRVLAGVERVRHARAWAPPKAVWLVVVTGALPILAAETTMFAFAKLSRAHV